MPITIVRSVWAGVAEPETLQSWIKLMNDPNTSYGVRRSCVGKLRGALTYYRNDPNKPNITKHLTNVLQN